MADGLPLELKSSRPDVIPSHDLVIVKLGWAYTPHDDHVAVERLVRETIAALQPAGRP
jgi:hypothetical protein